MPLGPVVKVLDLDVTSPRTTPGSPGPLGTGEATGIGSLQGWGLVKA